MRFEKHILCQVCRGVPIAGASKTPARNSRVMALEKLVDEGVPLTTCPSFRLGQQLVVVEFPGKHRADYSDGKRWSSRVSG